MAVRAVVTAILFLRVLFYYLHFLVSLPSFLNNERLLLYKKIETSIIKLMFIFCEKNISHRQNLENGNNIRVILRDVRIFVNECIF